MATERGKRVREMICRNIPMARKVGGVRVEWIRERMERTEVRRAWRLEMIDMLGESARLFS